MTSAMAPERPDHPWYLNVAPLATERWLIRLRWTTAVIEGAVDVLSAVLPHTGFPLRQIALAATETRHGSVAGGIVIGRA